MSGGKIALEAFLRGGSVGQYFRRDPANPKGGAWSDNAFPGESGGQATCTFSTPANSKTISVVDPGCTDTSVVTAMVGVPTSRSADELEMTPMDVNVGPLTPNGGFDLVVSCVGAGQLAEGTFTIYWSRK